MLSGVFRHMLVRKVRSLLDYIENPALIAARVKKYPMEFVRILFEIKKFLPYINNIFDIGAATGNCAHFVFPEANIFAFEPLPEKVDILKKIYERHKISGEVYNFALASEEGNANFLQMEYTNLSSILEPDEGLFDLFGKKASYEKIIVTKKRFDNAFNLDANSINFAKLDVQGYELEVLKGMGGELDKLQGIMLEVNFDRFYVGQASYIEIMRYLHDHGFKRFYQVDKVIIKGKVSWCDLVFFR